MYAQHLGLLAFILLFGGAAYIALRWPQGKHATLSQHVAVSRRKILFYILLFTGVIGTLLPFFFVWFMPTFQPSAWFGVYVIVSSATQYACGFIPEVGGWQTKWHRFLAGMSALFMIPALIILALADLVHVLGKVGIAFSLIVMLGVIFLLAKVGTTTFLYCNLYILAHFLRLFYWSHICNKQGVPIR